MKKNYVTPIMVCEEFAANEYVAACGDSGTVYKFECNAGSKDDQYYVYLNGEDGKAGTYDDIDWTGRNPYRPKTYSPCGITHEAESNSGFFSGYMVNVDDKQREKIPVVVWTENGSSTHCTSNLEMDKWETTKS